MSSLQETWNTFIVDLSISENLFQFPPIYQKWTNIVPLRTKLPNKLKISIRKSRLFKIFCKFQRKDNLNLRSWKIWLSQSKAIWSALNWSIRFLKNLFLIFSILRQEERKRILKAWIQKLLFQKLKTFCKCNLLLNKPRRKLNF